MASNAFMDNAALKKHPVLKKGSALFYGKQPNQGDRADDLGPD